MFKFDKTVHFDKKFKYTLIFISFSLINTFLSFYLKDIYVFLIRETIICFILLFHYYYGDELASLSKEDDYIRFILIKKYPILRLEFPLAVGFTLGLIVFINFAIYPDCAIICMIVLIICCAYSILVFYSVFCILRTPEVRSFYGIKKSISQYGIRSYGTYSKVFHACKLCAKVGALGGVSIWLTPKILHQDLMYRGDLMNTLAYPFTGIKAHNDWDMMKANQLLDCYPDDRTLIMKKDGCTINSLFLRKQMEARNIKFPPIDLDHSHSFNFWPFSRKGK